MKKDLHGDNRLIGRSRLAAVVVVLMVLTGLGMWHTAGGERPDRELYIRRPSAVMGTESSLAAVVAPGGRSRAEEALEAAERSLRRVEALMSAWIEDSELSRLNRAGAGIETPLSPETLAVLRAARAAYDRTGGAFDVTCRPLIELWREAERQGRMPTGEQIEQARAESRWDHFELTESGAVKSVATARIDLGGIAKGYGIDRAAEALEGAGLMGGMVFVGGDLALFGEPSAGHGWPVRVRDPADENASLGMVVLSGGAVCTSGDYARYGEIQGRRLSHIIDPRTGWPAESASSVTVLAPDALTADVWATALAVLGPEGFDMLPEGVEALMLTGSPEATRLERTAGFPELE